MTSTAPKVERPSPYTGPGECNFCGGTAFRDKKDRVDAKCATCGALERTRLLWMTLQSHPMAPGTRVLHIAPEKALYDAFKAQVGDGYVCADLEPGNFPFAPDCRTIDLTRLEDWETGSFDLIVHSHVMEHIPCTLAYPLWHLHRMLSPAGRHVCVIPFLPGHYDECLGPLSGAERRRRFGQNDHVRRIGTDDVDQHLGKLLRLPDAYDATARFGSDALDRARIPPHLRRGLTIATVLDLGRDDMLLRAGGD